MSQKTINAQSELKTSNASSRKTNVAGWVVSNRSIHGCLPVQHLRNQPLRDAPTDVDAVLR